MGSGAQKGSKGPETRLLFPAACHPEPEQRPEARVYHDRADRCTPRSRRRVRLCVGVAWRGADLPDLDPASRSQIYGMQPSAIADAMMHDGEALVSRLSRSPKECVHR